VDDSPVASCPTARVTGPKEGLLPQCRRLVGGAPSVPMATMVGARGIEKASPRFAGAVAGAP
jgi:hypothetical protein